MTVKKEARQYARKTLQVRGEMRLSSGVSLEGEVCNVSMSGILFKVDMGSVFPFGKEQVFFTMRVKRGSHAERIWTQGTVSRIADKGMALHFSWVQPESRPRLEQLLRYET